MTENLSQIHEDIGAIKSKLESLAQKLREVESDSEKNLSREVEDLSSRIDEISRKLQGSDEENVNDLTNIERRLKILEFGFDASEKRRIKVQKITKAFLVWMVRGLLLIIPGVIKVLNDNGVFTGILKLIRNEK